MTPSSDIRWQQRLVNFERALALLREALINGPAALAWKTTKDYMEASGFVFGVVVPRQVIKDAFAAKVLEDGATWMAMLDHRNLLSHTYNPAVFEQAVAAIHQRYLPGMEQLHAFLQKEAMP
jgi:nucleotidyltransferase substrate binding protein (TIGR01987 family)